MNTKIILCVCMILLLGAACAFADGILITYPKLQDEVLDKPGQVGAFPKIGHHPLSVKYHRVRVNIQDRVARTVIDQVFRNEQNVDLEGIYLFPIPENAAITDFTLFINGKRMSGQILEKDKAKEVYEEIVKRMRDPGLLEYYGRDLFRVRVYPVGAHSETRIQLAYNEIIRFEAGTYRYVYPLDTERFSPLPIEEIVVEVDIGSSVPIKSVYSPTHAIDIRKETIRAKVGYEGRSVKPSRDFVLYYTVSEEDIGLNVLFHRNPGEKGYFMLMVATGVIDIHPIPKDLVFILDTSGSMREAKIAQAKATLRFCLKNLGENDRFSIVQFATTTNLLSNTLLEATPGSVKEALTFVEGFDARGGTNIHDALEAGFRLFESSERPKMVLFITDGEPTVGETDMPVILQDLLSVNTQKARVFVFGVGHDVNTHLLDSIAEEHRGLSEYVRPDEDLEWRVSTLYKKISDPILSDIHLDLGKIRTSDIYPVTLPDIFRGEQLLLVGRYRSEGEVQVTLSGSAQGMNRRFRSSFEFPLEKKENDFLPRIWATRRIGYLMSEIRLKGEHEELIDEILRLSTEFGIVTPYTSFLIVERETNFTRWGIPQGMEAEVREKGERYRATMRKTTGEEPVAQSMDIQSMKERSIPVESSFHTVKQVGAKTFYLRNGIWVDSQYREGMAVEEVKFLSGRYFGLLSKNPSLGRYFSNGKNIIVVFGSKCFKISE